jgi:integrase
MKGTLTKYRKSDGRISWGYYFKADGRQITKQGFATREVAANALGAAIAQHQNKNWIPPSTGQEATGRQPASRGDTRTLKEYLPYWLTTHAATRCAPKTLERYHDLTAYLSRHLGNMRLCDLKASHIQEAVNLLKTHGGQITEIHREGRPLSAKTVRSIATLLYTCLSDAARLDHIPENPMANKRVKLPKRPQSNPAVLDIAMLGQLFEKAMGTRLYPLVVTATSSGCRRGELLCLLWEDLDFKTGVLTVCKSLEQTRAGLRVKGTKSDKPRSVGLDDFALEVLQEHRENQQKDKANFGSAYQDHGLIFCQPNGDYYSPDRVGARVKELLVKAGLADFSLHSLRHSHASVLLGVGTPIAVVSERLGHGDQNITLSVYSHSLPADRLLVPGAMHWRKSSPRIAAANPRKI